MNGGHQRLWLALRFRDLPLSALEAAASPDQPIAVAERRRVVFRNAAASALGVTLGMDLMTAELLSGCQTLPRDRTREDAALHRLRDLFYRLTPHIDIHRSRTAPQAGLLLEISTCLRLFGGAKALRDDALALAAASGHDPRPGLAHTAPGAWLLTFARDEISGDESAGIFRERLDRLPVQVLYDHPDAVDALVNMGFTTLGDVVQQIESSAVASFTRRLGRDFAAALTEIYGSDGDFSQASLFTKPVTTYVPEDHFEDSIQFDFPVSAVAHLRPAMEDLLQGLDDFLRRRQLACQHIQWRISNIHQRRETIEVHSDLPQNDWQLLYDLSLITFDNRSIPFEVDCLALSCRDRLPRQGASHGLDFSGGRRPRGATRELAVTMAKLKSRLGDAAVHKVSYSDSLLPELSHRVIGLAEKCAQQLPGSHARSLRPSWLFAAPQPVEQRRGRLYWQGYLALAVGPERVVGHWWENTLARDYYLARRQDDVALWVYRDLHTGEWYVQGVFS